MANELTGIFLTLFVIGFIGDLFIPSTFDLGSDVRLFALSLLWIFIVKIAGFKSSATFKIALLFLFILFFYFLFFRTSPQLERMGSWIYIFLLIGIVQQFLESRKQA